MIGTPGKAKAPVLLPYILRWVERQIFANWYGGTALNNWYGVVRGGTAAEN